MDEDIKICHCMGIMRSETIKVIKEKRLKTADEVGKETTDSTVCGSWIPDIEYILQEING